MTYAAFWIWSISKLGITKPCTHLHPAPSTSTQLISTSTQLHSPPPSSLQHPQQYLNQNIVISPNLGQKIKSCPFFLKIGTHGILTMLILIPALVFWISTLNPFLGKFGLKRSKLSSLAENWYAECLEDVNFYSDNIFLSFEP